MTNRCREGRTFKLRHLCFFRYDLGSGPALLTAGSDDLQHVRVGQLHRALATVDGRNGSLTLDDGVTVFGTSRGYLSSLNVLPSLYIGRVPTPAFSSMYYTNAILFYTHVVVATNTTSACTEQFMLF